MGRAEYGGRHRRPSCRHRRGPAAVGRHRRTHTVPDRQTAVSESRPDSGASTGATATSGSTSTNASGRPRTSGRCSTWSCGGPESGPPTYPQQRRRKTSSASSSRPVAGPSPSTVLLRILRCQPIPADRHSDSATFRDNPSYPATPRTLRTRFDRPVHFWSTCSYAEHPLIVNRGGDGRDIGALRGVP